MPLSYSIDDLLELMAQLRNPQGGCPWDRQQTFTSLAPHTIEEAYEVGDAIDRGDMSSLQDELGDLLFQVVFYAQLAKEQSLFDFTGVVTAVVTKLRRRHPHVFGNGSAGTLEQLNKAWEDIKTAERAARGEETTSLLDGISCGLPGFTRALKLQKRAARVGFDWEDGCAVLDKLEEEAEELRQERADGGPPERIFEEMGDVLFTCVNLARHHQVDPETALRAANRRFEQRFREMESLAKNQHRTLDGADLEQLNDWWEQAKINC